jgi:hypothetical protein
MAVACDSRPSCLGNRSLGFSALSPSLLNLAQSSLPRIVIFSCEAIDALGIHIRRRMARVFRPALLRECSLGERITCLHETSLALEAICHQGENGEIMAVI